MTCDTIQLSSPRKRGPITTGLCGYARLGPQPFTPMEFGGYGSLLSHYGIYTFAVPYTRIWKRAIPMWKVIGPGGRCEA